MNTLAKEEVKRFNYLISEIDALYHEASVGFGFSDSAMQILYTLCVCGDRCPLSDVTKLSGVSKQTINSSIRVLEKKEILYLEFQNGKNKLVCLTDKGKDMVNEKVLPLVSIENQIFDEWNEEESEEFFRLLQKYQNDLKRKLSLYLISRRRK